MVISVEKICKQKKVEFGSKNEMVVEIDASKNAVGTIIWMNTESEKLTGYNSDELIGKSIDILIPNSVALNHNRRILDYMNTNRSTMLLKRNDVVLINIRGEGVRCNMWVKPSFDASANRIVFNGYLEEISWGENFMLVDNMGHIEAVGKKLSVLFDLQVNNVFKEQMSIFKFSTTLFDYLCNMSRRLQARFNNSNMVAEVHKVPLYKEEWKIGDSNNSCLSELLESLNMDYPIDFETFKNQLYAFMKEQQKNYYVEFSIQEFNSVDGNVVNYMVTFNIIGKIIGFDKRSSYEKQIAEKLEVILKHDQNYQDLNSQPDFFYKYKKNKELESNKPNNDHNLANADNLAVKNSLPYKEQDNNIKMRRVTILKTKPRPNSSIVRSSVNLKNPQLVTQIYDIDPGTNTNSKAEALVFSNAKFYKVFRKTLYILLAISLVLFLLSIVLYHFLLSTAINDDFRKRTSINIHINSYLSKLMSFYNFAETVRIYPRIADDSELVQKTFERIVSTSYVELKNLDKILNENVENISKSNDNPFIENYGQFKSILEIAKLFYYKSYSRRDIRNKLMHFQRSFEQLNISRRVERQIENKNVYFGSMYWEMITRVILVVLFSSVFILLVRLFIYKIYINRLNNLIKAIIEVKVEELDPMLIDKFQKFIAEVKPYCQERFNKILSKTFSSLKNQSKNSEPHNRSNVVYANLFGLRKNMKWTVLIISLIVLFGIINLFVLAFSPKLISDINAYYNTLFNVPIAANIAKYELISIIKKTTALSTRGYEVDTIDSNSRISFITDISEHKINFEKQIKSISSTKSQINDAILPGYKKIVDRSKAYHATDLCKNEKSLRYEVFFRYCQSIEGLAEGEVIIYPENLISKIKQHMEIIYNLLIKDSEFKEKINDPSSATFSTAVNELFKELSVINDLTHVIDNYNYDFYNDSIKIGIEECINWLFMIKMIELVFLVILCIVILLIDKKISKKTFDYCKAAFWFLDIIPEKNKQKMKMMSIRRYF